MAVRSVGICSANTLAVALCPDEIASYRDAIVRG